MDAAFVNGEGMIGPLHGDFLNPCESSELMESSPNNSAPGVKRTGSSPVRKGKSLAIYVAVFVLFVTVTGQFWEFERKSELFSLKDRIRESYAALQRSDFASFGFLQANDTLKLENDRLAGELFSLREEKIKQSARIEELKRETEIMRHRLRRSVEFLPLKDVNVAPMTEPDRTWFMSGLRGRGQNGDPEHYHFPSEASDGKILCVKGRHSINGTLNSYGFSWLEYLPSNSTLLPGLSVVTDNFWDYQNPWHSMMALAVAVAWRMENHCVAPQRFVLYHNGGLVKSMGSWIDNVLRAALDREVEVDPLEYGDGPVCFERAVVYRRGFDRMSLQKRLALFDVIRCKARNFCKISTSREDVNGTRTVNLTLLARTGPRSFRNESLVASVIAKECAKVPGCHFRLQHIVNLSFCEQVELMSRTDVLATAHGAQLANMVFMSQGSSVMEMFPKGWLEGAGVGQYIYHWFASWTGMNHEGTYRDTDGPDCPNPEDGRVPCFLFHKNAQVGHNETFLAQWTANVLRGFRNRTAMATGALETTACPCD